jgi:hypothetical protein
MNEAKTNPEPKGATAMPTITALYLREAYDSEYVGTVQASWIAELFDGNAILLGSPQMDEAEAHALALGVLRGDYMRPEVAC